ncbi:hypothetical protein OROHE_009345 [Orobanche hederae]
MTIPVDYLPLPAAFAIVLLSSFASCHHPSPSTAGD